MCIDTELFAGLCLRWERGVVMKYFDDPIYNSQFQQFIDCFAELIEKYGGNIVFPEDRMKQDEIDERMNVKTKQVSRVNTSTHAA